MKLGSPKLHFYQNQKLIGKHLKQNSEKFWQVRLRGMDIATSKTRYILKYMRN